MELVYLWVDNYKNIEKQGFNFSPRFECSYDGENLTICDKKKKECKDNNYIENFFGDNVNVTAIVGENGSGKSSVLEAISLLYHNHYIDVLKSENKIFIVFKIETDFYIMSTKDNGYAYKKEFRKIENKYIFHVDLNSKTDDLSGEKYYLSYFSNCLTDMTKQKRFSIFKNKREGDKSYFYNGLQPLDLNKQQITPFENKNDTYDYFNVKFADILKDNDSFFIFIEKNLIFDSYKFEIHISDLVVYFLDKNLYKDLITFDSNYLFPDINQENSENYFYKFMALYIIKESINIIGIETDEKYKSQGATIDYINKAIIKFIELVKGSFNDDCSKKDYYKNILEFCSKYIDENLFSTENIEKLLQDYTYMDNNIWKSKSFNIAKKNINHYVDNNILAKLEKDNIFRIDFFKANNEEYNFLSLSSGEQEYLKILTNFSYTMKHYVEGQNNIILFDEVELSMHPNWQKKLINNLDLIIKSFKKKNTYTNIIITSHSPFILSDLPKENVIFLKQDENGNCKNVTKETDINTFGANIHTLLSHGFFMSDGFTGEFAKEKINKAITYLNQKKLSKDKIGYCEDIISIIGEPIIKNQLQRMLDSKRLSKVDEIDKLKEEMELIKDRIEILRKNQ